MTRPGYREEEADTMSLKSSFWIFVVGARRKIDVAGRVLFYFWMECWNIFCMLNRAVESLFFLYSSFVLRVQFISPFNIKAEVAVKKSGVAKTEFQNHSVVLAEMMLVKKLRGVGCGLVCQAARLAPGTAMHNREVAMNFKLGLRQPVDLRKSSSSLISAYTLNC